MEKTMRLNAKDFLERALGVYSNMMARRWGANFFRSVPERLTALQGQLKVDADATTHCAQLDVAIESAETGGRNKFSIILKIAPILFAIEKKEITEE